MIKRENHVRVSIDANTPIIKFYTSVLKKMGSFLNQIKAICQNSKHYTWW